MILFACAFNLQSFMSQTDLIVHNNLDQSIFTSNIFRFDLKYLLHIPQYQISRNKMTEFHKGTGLEIFTLCLHWAAAQHTCSAYKHIFTATGVYNFDIQF